ncbi:DUF805 domain-containing protein [Sulfitobacter sp. TSTF-M16]|uniref:DUF805 domain-containing protein n=2 Tax=Sulfitobacter aestuariivivens TaxID=2766981 RepID=A0A927D6A3_9RHOB|nr:DUF805 domain-containing protein [Sulfitobacter aestuariivivens]MBD3664017.1 DUF805 domain-containing protein [Sulfitobacter aestuariivivens]
MDFTTAVRTCLTQKYATFQGRASRPEYWWFILAVVIGSFVALLLGPLSILFTLAVLCPALAVGFRRLQDTGRPGWWIVFPAGLGLINSLIAPDMPDDAAIAAGQFPSTGSVLLSGLIGIVGLVVSLVFLWWLTRPSDPETNQYGPPPASVSD